MHEILPSESKQRTFFALPDQSNPSTLLFFKYKIGYDYCSHFEVFLQLLLWHLNHNSLHTRLHECENNTSSRSMLASQELVFQYHWYLTGKQLLLANVNLKLESAVILYKKTETNLSPLLPAHIKIFVPHSIIFVLLSYGHTFHFSLSFFLK